MGMAFTPTISHGETYMGLQLEWSLNSGQNIKPKYGSGVGSRSRIDPHIKYLSYIYLAYT